MTDQLSSQFYQKRAVWAEQSDRPVLAYVTTYAAGTRISPHHHRRGQFIHALNGSMRIETRGGRYLVVPGAGIYIPPGTEHAIDVLGELDWRTVHIGSDFLDDWPESPRLVSLSPLIRELLAAASALPREGALEPAQHRLLAVLVDQIHNAPAAAHAVHYPEDPRARRLADRLVAAQSCQVDFAGLTKQAGLSTATANRLFRQSCGMSPSQWLRRVLVLTAIERLATGEAVASVAYDLGYESASAFSAMFAKVTDAPPSTYSPKPGSLKAG